MNEELKSKIDISKLPLISQYRVLVWDGRANGTLELTPRFTFADIQNKYVVIKSIRLVPYNFGDYVDFYTTPDGVTFNTETIQNNLRMNRVFDDFVFGTSINFLINNNPLPIFVPNSLCYPLDLWIDNVFYLYPARIETLNIFVNSRVEQDISGVAGGLVAPNVRFVVECYLL